MRQQAAKAAAGVAALLLGFGLMHLGVQRHAPAGHRASSQTILAVSAPSFALPSSEDSARLVAEIERREAERLETERLERVAREEAEAREAEAAELARVAAVRAEKARKAAEALSTPTTVRAAPVARTPAVSSGNTSGVDINCESGGNYASNTGNGYFGAFQFDRATGRDAVAAAGYDGSVEGKPDYRGTTANNWPPHVQNEAAAEWVRLGHRGAWPNC